MIDTNNEDNKTTRPDLYIKIGSVCPSVCATVSASINPLPSDRLRCCDRYIRCQRSLVVKPLTTRDGPEGRAGVGLWTLTRMCSITQTDATSHNRAKRDCDLLLLKSNKACRCTLHASHRFDTINFNFYFPYNGSIMIRKMTKS